MNENLKWYGGAVAVVGLTVGAIYYFDQRRQPEAPPEKPAVARPAEPVLPEEPAIKHPLAAPETQEALPQLDESDASMQNALTGLIGSQAVEQFVISKDLVRHIVVSVDNLSEEKVTERIRPMKPIPGAFVVEGSEEVFTLDPANFERYKPLVKLIGTMDTRQLVATYTRYYPLFQEAYESLGHPPEYFNDRLVQVIDHLLATPDIQGPIALARPGVLYEFADPQLESRSAGQKALIRMGSDNAAIVKEKLRVLRAAIVTQQPGN